MYYYLSRIDYRLNIWRNLKKIISGTISVPQLLPAANGSLARAGVHTTSMSSRRFLTVSQLLFLRYKSNTLHSAFSAEKDSNFIVMKFG